jgi:hypothetical protein
MTSSLHWIKGRGKKRRSEKNEPWQAWTPFVTIWKLIVESEEYFVVCLAVLGTNSREH